MTIIFDDINPTGSAPANIEVACINEIPAIPDLNEIIDEADNNGVPTVTWAGDLSDGNSCPELYYRTFAITDSCGNFIVVIQTITVNDSILPTASNPTAVSWQRRAGTGGNRSGHGGALCDMGTAAAVVAGLR